MIDHLISISFFRISGILLCSSYVFIPLKWENLLVQKLNDYSSQLIDILLTAQETPSSATEETTTHKEQFENGWPGDYPQMPEDSHSTAGTTGNEWFFK